MHEPDPQVAGHVRRGEDGDDAVGGPGPLGPDGDHVGPGVVGQHQRRVQETGEAQIVDVAPVAQGQVVGLVAQPAGAHAGVRRPAHDHGLLAGQQLDGVEDLHVTRAAAQVATQLLGGLGAGQLLAPPVEQGLDVHQDPRRAEPALQRAGGGEGVGEPFSVLGGEALERGDRAALGPLQRDLAADDGRAVEQDRAAAALAGGRAAVLGGEDVQLLAQRRQEMGMGPLDGDVLTVDREFHDGTCAPRWGVVGGGQT